MAAPLIKRSKQDRAATYVKPDGVVKRLDKSASVTARSAGPKHVASEAIERRLIGTVFKKGPSAR